MAPASFPYLSKHLLLIM